MNTEKMRIMKRKLTILVILVFVFAVAVGTALAAAPGTGTVYEGICVPDATLSDSRADILASYGEPTNCVDSNVQGAKDYCTYDVAGGGEVGINFRGPDGGEPSGSKKDVVTEIRWADEVDGWVTTAGVNTTMVQYDREAVWAAYPNGVICSDHRGWELIDYDLGIQASWSCAYIFCSASMSIFEPYTPPPPPGYMRVVAIHMSVDRRSVYANVLVLDEDDNPVEGAVVYTEITGYQKGPLYLYGPTDSDGYVYFEINKAHRGDYRLNISNVVKEGYVFDYDISIVLGTITKPK
jgi:hypothetical protein